MVEQNLVKQTKPNHEHHYRGAMDMSQGFACEDI